MDRQKSNAIDSFVLGLCSPLFHVKYDIRMAIMV